MCVFEKIVLSVFIKYVVFICKRCQISSGPHGSVVLSTIGNSLCRYHNCMIYENNCTFCSREVRSCPEERKGENNGTNAESEHPVTGQSLQNHNWFYLRFSEIIFQQANYLICLIWLTCQRVKPLWLVNFEVMFTNVIFISNTNCWTVNVRGYINFTWFTI